MFFGLNDVAFLAAASAAAGPGFDFLDPANIGQPVEGGFFAGLISHTADGNPTHALIVAPAATGASGTGYSGSDPQWKTTNTITAGADSLFDGAANTAAMVGAGIADHPAAQFCVNLSIGGFTDWYLPARWELDIAYFHLKPTTDNNNTGWGDNPYSVPRRDSKYTTGNPTQTTVTAFQSTQSEAFVAGFHWSSTEDGANVAWRLSLLSGGQTNGGKTIGNRVRAFRKLAL
jgi:hypothetical protein